MNEPGTVPPWGLSEIPSVLTYVNHGPDDWGSHSQLQWDYQIEWPSGGTPRIKLLRYRSFQLGAESEKLELVEDISENIPVNQLLLIAISKHAAGYLSACARLDGHWQPADRNFFKGCAEAAKKRYNLASYRKMSQVDPNPRI